MGPLAAVGFLIGVGDILRLLPDQIGPEPGDDGRATAAPDLVLIGDDGASGLRLEYNHRGHADEYELQVWGRYAVPVT